MVIFLTEGWPAGMWEKDWRGKTDVVRLLTEGWPEAIYRNPPLHSAAATVNHGLQLFALLMEHRPESKDELDNCGRTPLSLFENGGNNAQLAVNESDEITALLGGMY
jgi:hypothetical protein